MTNHTQPHHSAPHAARGEYEAGRERMSRKLVIATAVAACALTLPSLASARTVSRSGNPGYATSGAVYGVSQAPSKGGPYLAPSDPRVHRSSSTSGTQKVRAIWRFFQWQKPCGSCAGKWVEVKRREAWQTLYSGSSSADIQAQWPYVPSAALYSVDLFLDWYRASDGAHLGRVYADFDSATSTDYACWSGPCQVGWVGGSGYLYLGHTEY